ncbi:rhodanese-like domain-containing protein [Methylocapsa palsarum]|uniref:Rhodanese-related sulfurtransferase n=1 Tax=Methylocapsa palsarum TaxID=1612308 RepID=A0A1I3VY47_9HYPH|nr:rhodanese-like domain-containing protein [Methylocapsa palsarum]SFK00298.1 Rhodanese-related sulfurtransferase [Methylocapsa palsarum]
MYGKHLFIAAAAAAAISASFAWAAEQAAPAPAAEYKYKSPQLKRAELDALLAKPESLLVIDVRRPDELTAIGGLPVYLSIQAKDLESNLAYIPRERVIVTVSNHAGRAGAAADLLVSRGFNVAGAVGAQNYEAEGGALTKVAPPAPAPKSADAK